MRTVNTCMGGMSMTCSPGTAGSEVCDGTMADEDCDSRVDEEPAASGSCSFGGTALGAKGIGEAGTIGAAAAVGNAINDAISPFGAEVLELPYTPERILRALRRVP